MPARTKKERKQQKNHDRKRRELARRKRLAARAAASSPGEELRFDGPEPLNDVDQAEEWDECDNVDEFLDESSESGAKSSELSEQEEAALGLWWDKYSAADGSKRLEMIREKLETVSADDERCGHIFPEAVFELESKLPGQQYVAFLEELYEARHDVFAMGTDWNTRTMVFEYLAQDRLNDVDRAVTTFAKELEKVSESFFSLMSAIRLAGRVEASQALIDAAMERLDGSGLMYWTVDKVVDWAMFTNHQRCVSAGATEEAIAVLLASTPELGIKDSPEYQSNRRNFVLHLSGQSNKQWTKDELITGKEKASHKIYLLCADFQRWLCVERSFQPLVADELRHLVIQAISRIDCPFNRLLMGLTRRDFEPYIAQKLGFMSLDRIHAPATIVAMKHYYEFLKELELVKPTHCQKSHAVCDELWIELQKTLKDEWRLYGFLEQYMPA